MSLRQSASVHVCPLRLVPEILKRTDAQHLVSAINADLMPMTPEAIAADRHLKLGMHDIVEPRPGLVCPGPEHISELLEFVHSWDRREPMLIHCYAGISRSTAAAFIALCALNPDASEDLIASRLRLSSETACPNRLFIALADKMLGRDGRMITAVGRMGRGTPADECSPFGLPAVRTTGAKVAVRISNAA